jgi:hypothetical protein
MLMASRFVLPEIQVYARSKNIAQVVKFLAVSKLVISGHHMQEKVITNGCRSEHGIQLPTLAKLIITL